MKRILSLALVCILMLAGTTVFAEGEHNTNVKIQIFQSKVEIVEQLEALAAEYTKETGVEVEVLGATGDNFMDTLVGKLTSGQGPTIFNVAPGAALDQLHSYLYDISDQPYVADIADGMSLVYDGKVVGVPYGVEGYGIIYNKSLVDPAKMTNLADFTAAAEALKASGIDALELCDKSYFMIGHILNIPFAMQADPQAFLDKLIKGEATMAATPEFQEWAKFMEVIRANSGNPMGITYDDQIANFATGKTAMIHQGNWAWGMFDSYDVSFEMGFMPLPVMGNDRLPVGMPNAWCINNQRDPAEIEEALKFFEWFFTSERGQQYIAKDFGFIPALKSIQVTELNPLASMVHEYAVSGKTLPWMFRMWPNTAGMINNQFFPVAQKFFSDPAMTGEQFLQELDKGWVEGLK